MTRPTHLARQLAKQVAGTAKTGAPMRHARGVVVSSNIGETVVTLDGGSTHVTAFNYGHTQSLAAGTVVDVLLVGNPTVAYVIGAYGTAQGWTDVSFATGWSNYDNTGAAWQTAQYMKGADGLVRLRGLVNTPSIAGGSATSTIFTLPAGFRPATGEPFDSLVSGDQPIRVDVNKDGTVVAVNTGSTAVALGSYMPLSGIVFQQVN